MLLTLWPSLLDYSFFAPLILRVVLGLTLIWSAKGQSKLVLASKTIGGLLLVVGLFTQPVAVILGLYLIIEMARGGKLRSEHLLMLAILVALILLGPGAYAFDLPL